MFKRRNSVSLLTKMRNFVWPELGWKRYGQYILMRLNRLKGTPREIAAGVACGVAISFTPFVGFHFVLAAVTAWLVRGNILASAIGTAAGNPWTFPIIWVSVLYTGRRILGIEYRTSEVVNFTEIFSEASKALISFDFRLFFGDIWPILWPMVIGCIPFYIISWFLSYYVFKVALERIANKKRRIK